MGAVAELLTRLPYGTGIVVLVALIIVAMIVLTRNWTRESLAQIIDLLAILRRNVRHRKSVSDHTSI